MAVILLNDLNTVYLQMFFNTYTQVYWWIQRWTTVIKNSKKKKNNKTVLLSSDFVKQFCEPNRILNPHNFLKVKYPLLSNQLLNNVFMYVFIQLCIIQASYIFIYTDIIRMPCLKFKLLLNICLIFTVKQLLYGNRNIALFIYFVFAYLIS